ncbi:1-deoxy-D-xylulose-5-phosphate synthase [Streptomyces tendae]
MSKTGGHLGPNLGVVELTLALHRVFDSPKDKVLWDTGHQSYVHKLLTGRQDFSKLKMKGGLSGYPSQAESEHDVIENSHASTVLGWADGIAKANQVMERDDHLVTVTDDGPSPAARRGGAAGRLRARARPSPPPPSVAVYRDTFSSPAGRTPAGPSAGPGPDVRPGTASGLSGYIRSLLDHAGGTCPRPSPQTAPWDTARHPRRRPRCRPPTATLLLGVKLSSRITSPSSPSSWRRPDRDHRARSSSRVPITTTPSSRSRSPSRRAGLHSPTIELMFGWAPANFGVMGIFTAASSSSSP